ncbi:MAG: glycerol kinase GlpK [Lentisphaerae bacterium]|jgi:glycerol kinase|nr:glycerol kinase GlpK [Lentisphaerota bacterium]MBT4815275.1 glycerol kinase GlpK [Lentisphaerota bacterium]MBT5611701.1 glycerol kinase GlpK [Lentisphaerota bacterium]MBT7061169.1 glycerol kinase GlpK [Lentisphaerota bacterium]MBT7848462.1 glycerol kinase GlpK [Lentisphaerota bacterium]
MADQYILALDQGTTSSRAIVFGRSGLPVAVAQVEFPQVYPQPGWVEHDPEVIWCGQHDVAEEALKRAGIGPSDVAAIGITNQRETTVVWDRRTGEPIHNAIVWQCRRTAAICEQLARDGMRESIQAKTGLVLDPYFSGTKLKWILDTIPGAREAARQGDILFGTVDSWLLWRLTEGRVHATDVSNASRTMLLNIHTLDWDPELLGMLDIPREMLPEVVSSSGICGETRLLGDRPIPIAGMAGDQQAALFGQACFSPGMAKNTYGTGCFLLMNIGDRPVTSRNQLLTTVAWRIGGVTEYALEGSVFMGGATIQWLRDELGLIRTAAESETVAAEVESTEGVYLVPAFTGLGAPYWDPEARGAIVGMTRGTGRAHIVRAALEAIAYQTRDVLDAMQRDSAVHLAELRVDGGATANDLLLQVQADVLGADAVRPVVTETTALGAAYLAGLAIGYWSDRSEIAALWQPERRFTPRMAAGLREDHYNGWEAAVARCRGDR